MTDNISRKGYMWWSGSLTGLCVMMTWPDTNLVIQYHHNLMGQSLYHYHQHWVLLIVNTTKKLFVQRQSKWGLPMRLPLSVNLQMHWEQIAVQLWKCAAIFILPLSLIVCQVHDIVYRYARYKNKTMLHVYTLSSCN